MAARLGKVLGIHPGLISRNAASKASHKTDLFLGETSIFEKNANHFGKFQAAFERRNFVLAGSHLSSIAGPCLLTATSAVPQLVHGKAKYFKEDK